MFYPDSDYRPDDWCNHCDRHKSGRPPARLSIRRPAYIPYPVVTLRERCQCGAVSILHSFRPYDIATDTERANLILGSGI